jgi:formylglycine-generating enzyme
MIKSWTLAAVGLSFACSWIGCGNSGSGTDQTAVGAGGQDAGSDVSKGGAGGVDASADSGGSAGTAGAGVQTCADAGTCGPFEELGHAGSCALCVAKSVTVALSDGGPGYTIDATEVTYSQYAAWLATGPTWPPSTPDNVCSWKTGFNPGTGSDSYPVASVDWCDAWAYCAGVGKRLCGKIGGGANLLNDYADETKSQWYNACSSGGRHNYPYSSSAADAGTSGYDGQKCNGYDKGAGWTMGVGVCAECHSSESGYTGVFDLSGNVSEWEDSCNGSTSSLAYCRLRGGSFDYYSVDNLWCGGYGAGNSRNTASPAIGLRCCGP